MDAQTPHTQPDKDRKSAEVVVYDLAKQSGDDENSSLVFQKISQNLANANVRVQFVFHNKAKEKVVAGFPNKEEQSKDLLQRHAVVLVGLSTKYITEFMSLYFITRVFLLNKNVTINMPNFYLLGKSRNGCGGSWI